MIHPTALISNEAYIGDNVEIGAFSIIHDRARIGENSKIGSYCEIGISNGLEKDEFVDIGANSNIRSHSVIYAGSCIGEYLNTGHYVTIRENSTIGMSFQLGSRGDVQGDCVIGSYVKCHSDVHIGKLSEIHDYVWLFPNVLLTNDPTPPSDELIGVSVGKFAVITSNTIVMPGVKIGEDSVISAGSLVKQDVEAGYLYAGNPAKKLCAAKILRHHANPKVKAYPWRQRFHRGYSQSDIEEWVKGQIKT